MYNTMEYTEHVTCNISNLLVALALEWGRAWGTVAGIKS